MDRLIFNFADMKKLLIACFVLGLSWQFSTAQQLTPELQKNLQFEGAKADQQ